MPTDPRTNSRLPQPSQEASQGVGRPPPRQDDGPDRSRLPQGSRSHRNMEVIFRRSRDEDQALV